MPCMMIGVGNRIPVEWCTIALSRGFGTVTPIFRAHIKATHMRTNRLHEKTYPWTTYSFLGPLYKPEPHNNFEVVLKCLCSSDWARRARLNPFFWKILCMCFVSFVSFVSKIQVEWMCSEMYRICRIVTRWKDFFLKCVGTSISHTQVRPYKNYMSEVGQQCEPLALPKTSNKMSNKREQSIVESIESRVEE